MFPAVFVEKNKVYTKSIAPRTTVYGERVVRKNGTDYREWNPFRSKLCAALKNGLKEMPIKPNGNALYLGAGEGTTVSHISDIVGAKGAVFGVDVSAIAFKKFLKVCEKRANIYPILADASRPKEFAKYLEGFKIDLLFQDVSQKNQPGIFIANAREFLQKNATGLLSLKARSVDSSKKPEKVFREERNKLAKEFEVIQQVHLRPFEKDHAMFLCKKK